MPGKRKHSDPAFSQSVDLENPLPAPSTSRTLRPRSATVSRTRAPRTACRSHFATSSRQSSTPVSSQSLSMDADQPIASSSASMQSSGLNFGDKKRRKTRESHPPAELTSDSEEEIDQLISDREISILSASIPESLFIPDDSPILSNATNTSTSGIAPVSPNIPETLQLKDIDPSLTTAKSQGPILSTPQLRPAPPPPAKPQPEPLSAYTCPICFFPPTNATLTLCGHICCGPCLFTAVKTTLQRGAQMTAEASVARCPVCRADIPGWDGRGGGVIGLKARAMFSL